MNKFRIILVLFGLLNVTIANAAIETISERIEGSAITSGVYTTYDSKYFDMLGDPSWNTHYTNHKIYNTVQLGINPEVLQTTSYLSGEVRIKVEYQTWNYSTSQFDWATELIDTLSVTYDASSGTTQIDDLSTMIFEDGLQVKVTVLGVTSLDVDDLFLETTITTERYYAFDGAAPSNLSHQDVLGSSYVEFSWTPSVGAEFYELEWVHINDYKTDTNTFFATSSLPYNYYLNSTRISIKEHSYRIPKIFDHGYLIYRVRGVGMQGTDFDSKLLGSWTNVESGLISAHTELNVYAITTPYDENMNWSHQVGYTENGKRMEALSFADGLGRGRQTVAHNPETEQVIVSNVYYDDLGRPVISDLPTPVDSEDLKHYPDFNRADIAGNPSFQFQYFDTIIDTCSVASTMPFADTYGAGKYYSPNNPDLEGENTFIPDAQKYPYSRVAYKSDFTGRVTHASAAGEDLKQGSGHETKYVYPSPNQNELNRLFGSEVGNYKHYTKMITIDPNGQIYVQYSDLAGRVVASFLAGGGPSNVEKLAANGQDSSVFEIFDFQVADIGNPVPTTSFHEVHYIYDDNETYTFTYAFTPQEYENACLENTICFDCMYDVSLSIVDDCGIDYWDTTFQVNGTTFNNACLGIGELSYQKEVVLPQGEYNISKSLSVSQSAIDEYWCAYLENDTCSTALSDFFNSSYANESFDECDPTNAYIGNDTLTPCDTYKSMMLQDLIPGGQYAEYADSSGFYTSSDPTSIFYDDAWENVTYFDENGDTIFVQNGLGTLVEPNELTETEFIQYFDPIWAEALLDQHPEACYLDFCEDNLTGLGYTQEMLDIYSFDTACANGYFVPVDSVTVQTLMNPCNTSNNDPFFTSSGGAADYESVIRDSMDTYIYYDGTSYTMWEAAILAVVCPGAVTATAADSCLFDYEIGRGDTCLFDLIWVQFREFYLQEKGNYYYLSMQDYAVDNNCENDCIGSSQLGCENYADKVSRFGNLDVIFGMDIMANLDSVQTAIDTLFANNCQANCESYADDWMVELNSCDFSSLDSTDMANMYQDMVDLCMYGCDNEHPLGATTTPGTETTANGHSSIDDILEEYLGSGYENELCTELLVSGPGPYIDSADLFGIGTQPLDTCACEAIYQAEYDLANNNPLNFGALEEMLAFNTGVSMADAHYLVCECEAVLQSPWTPGYVWYSSTIDVNATLALSGQLIPGNLSCETNDCDVSCAVITADVAALATRFSGVTDFENTPNYEDILTNYLNNEYNYHLNYTDYQDFIDVCNGETVCSLSSEAFELQEVLTLLAIRGQLTNTSANEVELLDENIVYSNSDMQTLFDDDDYWSSQADSTLTMTLDSGACDITLTAWDGFDFDAIVSFNGIYPTTSGCGSNTDFTIDITYIDCGLLSTGTLIGSSSCFDINDCTCDMTQVLCDEWFSLPEAPCYEPYLTQMYINAIDAWEMSIDSTYSDFTDDYNEQCAAAFATESLEYAGKSNTYQYTLFYYDQAGNLIKTVAPQGVDGSFTSTDASIDAARESVTNSTTYGATVIPSYDFETTYEYNSYNQLVETTNPDQDGDSRFFYDRYGRIAASQNPVQATENKYSYSKYDAQGRPVEVGQTVKLIDPTESDLKTDDKGVLFKTWADAGTKSEVTITTYDDALSTSVAALFKSGTQQNLRLRVATVSYFPLVNGATNYETDYESATHYSYDIHGNVIEQIQDVPMMAPVNLDITSTQYEFELISGNVKKVSYQKGEIDFMEHSYEYDKLNRLTDVYTTNDSVHQTLEANYRYYDYGPLARTEIGKYKVQGCDFAYTINGWLKGMNSSTLDEDRDMGHDGTSGYFTANDQVHALFAKDVAAYTMGYFNGDYSAIGTSTMELEYDGSNFDAGSEDLFNGNIRHTVTSIDTMPTMGNVYSYDQLQRLKEMTAFMNTNTANNWTGINSTTDYFNSYSYDRNGNMQNLQRNATSGIGLYMDDFLYSYQTVGGENSNRLDYVKEYGTNDGVAGDITGGMNANNYVYDEIGALITDVSEGIETITWRRGDKKIHKIERDDANSSEVEFVYNPFGVRVLKIEKPRSGGVVDDSTQWNFTYYTYDANGQNMAIYDAEMSPSTYNSTAKEFNIYGSSRIGQVRSGKTIWDDGVPAVGEDTVYQNTVGMRYYEVTNHLGNVLAVINDRRMVESGEYVAVVINANDYYPFGMVMPGRSVTNEAYRYAYNGMELDNEVKGDGNSYATEFRQYDPRLGRWLSLDPLKSIYPQISPYVYAGNTPIAAKDPDGRLIIFVNGYTEGFAGMYSCEPLKAYWKGKFIERAGAYFGDNNNHFVDGSFNALFPGSTRAKLGRQYVKDNIDIFKEAIENGEEIHFVTHSMGAAYGEGMIEELAEQGIDVTDVIHFSAADPDEIVISATPDVKRTQINASGDQTLLIRDGVGANGSIPGIDNYAKVEWTQKKYHPLWSKKNSEKWIPSKPWDSHYDTKGTLAWDWLEDFEESKLVDSGFDRVNGEFARNVYWMRFDNTTNSTTFNLYKKDGVAAGNIGGYSVRADKFVGTEFSLGKNHYNENEDGNR